MGAPRIMSGPRDPRAFNPAAGTPQSVFDSWRLLPAPRKFYSKVILVSDLNPLAVVNWSPYYAKIHCP